MAKLSLISVVAEESKMKLLSRLIQNNYFLQVFNNIILKDKNNALSKRLVIRSCVFCSRNRKAHAQL